MKKILLLIVTGLVTIFSSCSQQGKAVEAVVDAFVGEVSINGVAIEPGTKINSKVQVVTGADSFVDIVYGTKNIFRVFENTTISLDLKDLSKSIYVKKGGVGLVLGKPTLNNESFVVETDVAVAAVRGTIFDVVVEDDNQVYVCTCNGEIDHSAGKDWKKTISASHHKSYRLQKSADGTLTELPAGLEYHSDAAMDMLATKVGLKIDWESVHGLSEKE